MVMQDYKGSCRCGSIRFTFNSPEILKVLRCNCSLCRRRGATMTEFTVHPHNIIIEAEGDCLKTYQFGTRIAKHHFCSRCGIYPFHQPASKPDHYRINVGCVDGLDSFSLPFKVFNGAAL